MEEALAQHDPDAQPAKPKAMRVTPPEKQDPEIRYGGAKEESKSRDEWGSGADGFKSPKTPADRLRKNVPYKVNCSLSHPKSFACQSLMERILGCSTSSDGRGEISDSIITPFISQHHIPILRPFFSWLSLYFLGYLECYWISL